MYTHISQENDDYLLSSENVNSDQVDLGVTVLASLGSGHINDLAGTTLDDNVAVLAKSRALHRVGLGSTGIGRLKGIVIVRHFLLKRSILSVACRFNNDDIKTQHLQ